MVDPSIGQANVGAIGPDDRFGPAGAAPLRPTLLFVSLVAIAVGALTVACLIAVGVVLVVVAQFGRDGTSDLLQQLQYDLPLRTRLSAATISALYLGLAVATLAAARLAGRQDWRSLVALAPLRRLPRRNAIIVLLTLAYAAGASFLLSSLPHRQIVTDGPTDYVLVGTIIANLALLAPVAEELLFRGWLYTALRARCGIALGFVVTAVLFAAMHWDANHRRMLLVLPLAIALGILRETTGSIKSTILLHAAYNLVIIAITLAET